MRDVKDLQEANAISDPKMRASQVRRLGKWQQAVIPFLMDASRKDRLDDYRSFSSDKGWTWANNVIAQEIEQLAGVELSKDEVRNAGKRVNEAINKYRDRQIELGNLSETRETAEEFNERLDNKWLKRVMSQGAATDSTTTIDNSVVAAELERDPNDLETFELDTDLILGTRNEQTQDEQIQQAAAASETEGTIASAAGTKISNASTDELGSVFAEKNAKKLDPKQAARVQAAQMRALKNVDTAHKIPKRKKELISLWDEQNLSRGSAVNGEGNNLTELGYLDQPAEVQETWVNGVALALGDRNLDVLPEYFEDVIYAHSDRIEKNNVRVKDNSGKKPSKQSEDVKKLGTASQEKVAEIQAKRKAIREKKKQKAEAVAVEKKRKAQERKDNKNSKLKLKNQKAEIQKAKEARKNEESNSGGKPESQGVVKATSTGDKGATKTGANNDQNRQGDTKKVSRKKQAIVATGNAEGIVTGNSASADTFNDFFRNMLGAKELKRIRKRVFYFETEEQAITAGYNPEGGSAYVGTVRGPKGERITGKPDIIVFILNKIAEGREGSLFMHEVGGHIGLDNILTTTERRGLESKIDNWNAEDYAKYGNESWYNDSLDDVISSKRPAQSPEHLMARYAIRNASNEAYQDDTGKVHLTRF